MAVIQLSDFEHKFDNPSSILHDTLVGSFVQASKVMTTAGLKSYLDSAYALYSMGKGEDIVISFLEEIPLVVKEVGEDIVEDITVCVIKMTSQTSASVLSLLLSSLPTVASRMNDYQLVKGYLRLMERMLALTPRGMRPMLNNVDKLTTKLTLGGLRRWVMYGATIFQRDFKAQIAYFGLISAESLQVLEQQRRGTLFVDNQRKLQFYLRAFYNYDFFLRPTSGDYETKEGLRPYIERAVIYIPDAYDDYKGNLNHTVSGIDCYRAACVHCVAHIMHTKKAFDKKKLNSLQIACISLIEDLRVEMLTIRKFLGFKKMWIALHPDIKKLTSYSPFIVNLVDLSRAILDDDYQPKQAFNADFKKVFSQQMQTNAFDAVLSYDLGILYYNIIKSKTNVCVNVSSLDLMPILYRDDNSYIWEFKQEYWLAGNPNYIPASQKQLRKTVSLMQMLNELDTETAGDDAQEIWTLETEFFPDELGGVSLNELEGKELVGEPFHYNEWDYSLQIYHPNWVTLYEKRVKKGNPAKVDAIFKKHKLLASRLKNTISKLQPQGLVKFKKQQDGSELDTDACVDAIVSIRGGLTPTNRIYVKNIQHIRDVSVNLLMDLSNSTNDNVVASNKTVLELMQEAVVLLSWAIDKIGDNLAITGFASDSRHDVQYYNFKSFNCVFDDTIKAKLASMRGGLSTRMGAAIRHAGTRLLQQQSMKKILLLLTDGEPADIDIKDPQHLIMDAKKAIEELKGLGIVTFCISLDANADEYVAHIFGKNRYLVINDVAKLPEKLPQLFISLTK